MRIEFVKGCSNNDLMFSVRRSPLVTAMTLGMIRSFRARGGRLHSGGALWRDAGTGEKLSRYWNERLEAREVKWRWDTSPEEFEKAFE